MPTSRPFAFNTSGTIPGTIQVGNLSIGYPTSGFTNSPRFWNGPDEQLGFVIAQSVPGNTQPTPILGVTASVGFFRTSDLTESSFIGLTNSIFNQSFTSGYNAATWLFSNGYWTNYPLISNANALDYSIKLISNGMIIDSVTASALDVLFNDLQSNNTQAGPSFYSVLEGFYPMLGLTSTTQVINANCNTSYDLQLSGGWLFTSLGMRGNGINTYAYTGKDYINITGEELWNTHFSIYGTIPGNGQSNGDLSVVGITTKSANITLNRISNGDGRYEYDCASGSDVVGDSGDFVIISNDGSNTYAYQNGFSTGYGAGTISYLTDSPSLYLGYSPSSSTCSFLNGYSVNTFGWASFGGFMNNTDMVNYQTIVNTFMTSIGRNTY